MTESRLFTAAPSSIACPSTRDGSLFWCEAREPHDARKVTWGFWPPVDMGERQDCGNSHPTTQRRRITPFWPANSCRRPFPTPTPAMSKCGCVRTACYNVSHKPV
jgi:hypothetical protein